MNNPPQKQLYWFALMLVIYEFTTYAANDMIMPGMPQVISHFAAPVTFVAASLTVYMLGSCMLQLVLGPIAEKYGRKRTILWGNSLFLIFTLSLALSLSIKMFMISRYLQGSCMAFTPLGYALIHKNFNDKQALKLTSLMANITILAPLIGPMLGGIVINYFGWRYVFVLSIITASVALWGLNKFTPEETIAKESQVINLKNMLCTYLQIIKLPGFLLGTISSAMIVLPALIWVATAPTLILLNAHLGIKKYILYQLLAQSGLMLSSIAMQFIAGRINLSRLMIYGLVIAIFGIGIGVIFQGQLTLIVVGLGIYTFGFGLLMGTIMRIVGTLPTQHQSMLFSLMAFLQTLIMAIALEIVNRILEYYSYSLASFTIINLLITVVASCLIVRFAYLNRQRLSDTPITIQELG
ncbi:MAG: MFS transporter [Burkholderiales bacterium]|nr:MFS transporter [Burkholderiales bacterium]